MVQRARGAPRPRFTSHLGEFYLGRRALFPQVHQNRGSRFSSAPGCVKVHRDHGLLMISARLLMISVRFADDLGEVC
jgi:hypothetical protein